MKHDAAWGGGVLMLLSFYPLLSQDFFLSGNKITVRVSCNLTPLWLNARHAQMSRYRSQPLYSHHICCHEKHLVRPLDSFLFLHLPLPALFVSIPSKFKAAARTLLFSCRHRVFRAYAHSYDSVPSSYVYIRRWLI